MVTYGYDNFRKPRNSGDASRRSSSETRGEDVSGQLQRVGGRGEQGRGLEGRKQLFTIANDFHPNTFRC